MPTPSLGPHLAVDPNTGTPVQAIDIGGGLFQPLTGGGGPIPGIPLN